MLRAPPKYSEKFYEGEIEGQKRRLARLKERQEFRRNQLSGVTKKRSEPDATPSNIEDILQTLREATVTLPCSLTDFCKLLDKQHSASSKPNTEAVYKALCSLASGQRPYIDIEEVDLSGVGGGSSKNTSSGGSELRIIKVHSDRLKRSKRDSPPSK